MSRTTDKSPKARRREREYLDALQAHVADTRLYLTDALKPERERAVCRAFLRCVGIPFGDQEIVASASEPVDVCFRDARFQVRELMEEGRHRGDEWKARQDRLKRARSMDDVVVPWRPPAPMSFADLLAALTCALEAKVQKYGIQRAALDALVYVNLTATRFLAPSTLHDDTFPLDAQGWRSVSILFPPYGIVVAAGTNAPCFLRSVAGKVLREWSDIHAVFDP